jgi:Xaa-Pro aminopeptidase
VTVTTTRAQPLYSRRAENVQRTVAESGLDALIVTHPPNLRYLTGFDGSMAALLLTRAGGTLVVDGRYITSTRERVSSISELRWLQVELAPRSLDEALTAVCTRAEVRAIGVEGAVMTLTRFERLNVLFCSATPEAATRQVRLVTTERVVERARIIKDEVELATLRTAGAMLSQAALEVLAVVAPGRSELDVAADIDALIRRVGFARPAFDTIVASGPNSALPHARPGARFLAPGDSVVLDFGGVYDGYCVDLTRTVQLAPATDAFLGTFAAVRAAQAAAIAAVRPGALSSAIDGAARQVLEKHGLADAFVHGTGHGLGLEVHEDPKLTKVGSVATDEVLRPGMVFTVEPGAYLPGTLGVRIEDDVVVTDEGYELLTSVPINPAADGGGRADTGRGAGWRHPAGA